MYIALLYEWVNINVNSLIFTVYRPGTKGEARARQTKFTIKSTLHIICLLKTKGCGVWHNILLSKFPVCFRIVQSKEKVEAHTNSTYTSVITACTKSGSAGNP